MALCNSVVQKPGLHSTLLLLTLNASVCTILKLKVTIQEEFHLCGMRNHKEGFLVTPAWIGAPMGRIFRMTETLRGFCTSGSLNCSTVMALTNDASAVIHRFVLSFHSGDVQVLVHTIVCVCESAGQITGSVAIS